MKNQIKKLNINKKTISNLSTPEMIRHLGGAAPTNGGKTCDTCYSDRCTRPRTCFGGTCDTSYY